MEGLDIGEPCGDDGRVAGDGCENGFGVEGYVEGGVGGKLE